MIKGASWQRTICLGSLPKWRSIYLVSGPFFVFFVCKSPPQFIVADSVLINVKIVFELNQVSFSHLGLISPLESANKP